MNRHVRAALIGIGLSATLTAGALLGYVLTTRSLTQTKELYRLETKERIYLENGRPMVEKWMHEKGPFMIESPAPQKRPGKGPLNTSYEETGQCGSRYWNQVKGMKKARSKYILSTTRVATMHDVDGDGVDDIVTGVSESSIPPCSIFRPKNSHDSLERKTNSVDVKLANGEKQSWSWDGALMRHFYFSNEGVIIVEEVDVLGRKRYNALRRVGEKDLVQEFQGRLLWPSSPSRI